MSIRAKRLLVAEIEVTDERTAEYEFRTALDGFREAVCPAREYGITLYTATGADVEELAGAQSELMRTAESSPRPVTRTGQSDPNA